MVAQLWGVVVPHLVEELQLPEARAMSHSWTEFRVPSNRKQGLPRAGAQQIAANRQQSGLCIWWSWEGERKSHLAVHMSSTQVRDLVENIQINSPLLAKSSAHACQAQSQMLRAELRPYRETMQADTLSFLL